MEPITDTIFALATALPPRQGSGIAITRLSGPASFEIAADLCGFPDSTAFPDRQFILVHLSRDGQTIDHAGLLGFKAPHSYTGEDVVEFHCHGGLAVIRALERALLDIGVRPAEPGEFTRRAFLNGRIDLVQAESIAAIVAAVGDASRREAIRQRSGALSEKVKGIRSKLQNLLGRIEVDFDYPEEKIEAPPVDEILRDTHIIIGEITSLIESYRKGQLLSGIRLAIIGRPNVGKSSILNMLLQEDRAIVTPQPGTTRDVVSATLTLSGVPVELLDTAGIRIVKEIETAEAEGIRRSWREVERAHFVLLVVDLSMPLTDEDTELVRQARARVRETGAPILLVGNKIDLPSACPAEVIGPMLQARDFRAVGVSAKTGEGVDKLRSFIVEILNLTASADEIFLTEARHKALLEEANNILARVEKELGKGMPQDVAATELWGADRALARLLGEGLIGADLDEIFGKFCVGK